jgi:cation diffusion facilitator CzcD-associated flavoprotein CzcO
MDVAIVGSGFGGIGMAVFLKRAGISFVIFEKAATLGGTWRDNTYPGAACDVPSDLYSFPSPRASIGRAPSRLRPRSSDT